MVWRRVIGAGIMFAGAGAVVAMAAQATLLAAAGIEAGLGGDGIAIAVAGETWRLLAGGVCLIVGGRRIYGAWRGGAPITNLTGDVAGPVGAVTALGLGAMLLYLLASGFRAENGPAALALGAGVTIAVALTRAGMSLRSGRT